jgi:hypothetical protein
MIGIVGSNGLIGNYLKTVVDHTHEFNSDNIDTVKNYKFDTVYVAAPTSNRLWANANAEKDIKNIHQLYMQLNSGCVDRVILIGTVDSILRNHVPYGHNRSWLETQLTQRFDTYILRLGALIHPTIKKNILYDLKHGQYLDSINLNTQIQWYDLDNLYKDICWSLEHNVRERNLVSEPIFNREIVQRFFPDYKLKSADAVNQSVAPYGADKQDIFQVMEKYLNV